MVSFPGYIKERIKVGLETYGMIMKSRPDKHKTMVMIVGLRSRLERLKTNLSKVESVMRSSQ